MGPAWLRGVFPPIATAFAADGTLRPSPPGFLEYLRDGDIDGVVALGSNGEAAHLSEAERLRWIHSVRSAIPTLLRLIVGTGADGGIVALANFAPAACAHIRRAWLAGDAEQARRLQRTIAPLGEALSRGYGVPGLKAGLRMLGYDHGDPRPPLPPLPATELT